MTPAESRSTVHHLVGNFVLIEGNFDSVKIFVGYGAAGVFMEIPDNKERDRKNKSGG